MGLTQITELHSVLPSIRIPFLDGLPHLRGKNAHLEVGQRIFEFFDIEPNF
jgi:hypothetical protein